MYLEHWNLKKIWMRFTKFSRKMSGSLNGPLVSTSVSIWLASLYSMTWLEANNVKTICYYLRINKYEKQVVMNVERAKLSDVSSRSRPKLWKLRSMLYLVTRRLWPLCASDEPAPPLANYHGRYYNRPRSTKIGIILDNTTTLHVLSHFA